MKGGIYECWHEPGTPEVEGVPGARAARDHGALIYIGSSVRKFRIMYRTSRPHWSLEEEWVVGTTHPTETYLPFASLSSLRGAIKKARKLAGDAAIRGPRSSPDDHPQDADHAKPAVA